MIATFLIYILKVNVLLFIVWVVHRLLLSKYTFHQLKRWYLVLGVVLSLVIPILTWKDITVIPLTISPSEASMPAETHIAQPIDGWMIAYVSVLMVILVFGIRASVRLIKAVKSLNNITNAAIKVDGYDNLYMSEQAEVPFSTKNNIYIHPNLLQSATLQQILLHEQKHIADKHYIDIWLLQVLNVCFSYNPIVKRLLHDVKLNHEFIVDAYMVQSVDPVSYQLQLVQFQHNNFQIDLANQFAFSNLKQRIIFMNTTQSSKWKWSSILLATIILGATSFAMAYENVTVYEITEQHINKDTTKQPLMLVNGKKYEGDINTIDPQTIAAVNVYKNAEAIKKYGKEGENGVVDVTLKTDAMLADTNIEVKVKVKIEKASADLNEKTQGTIEFTSKNDPAILKKNIKEVGEFADALLFEKVSTTQKFEHHNNHVDTFIHGFNETFTVRLLDSNDESKEIPTSDKVKTENDPRNSQAIKVDDDLLFIFGNNESLLAEKGKDMVRNPTFYVDGRKRKDVSSIDSKSIKSINVLKGKNAVSKYGKGYENGVIEIKLKK